MSEERRETATTPSSSLPSPEREARSRRPGAPLRGGVAPGGDHRAGQLGVLGGRAGRAPSRAELCEAFEAEIGVRDRGAAGRRAARGGRPARACPSASASGCCTTRCAWAPWAPSEPVHRSGARTCCGIDARALALAAGGDRRRPGPGGRRAAATTWSSTRPRWRLLEAVTEQRPPTRSSASGSARTASATPPARRALARAAKALGESLDPDARARHALRGGLPRHRRRDRGRLLRRRPRRARGGGRLTACPTTSSACAAAPDEGLCGRVVATGAPQISNAYQAGAASLPTPPPRCAACARRMSAPLRRRGRARRRDLGRLPRRPLGHRGRPRAARRVRRARRHRLPQRRRPRRRPAGRVARLAHRLPQPRRLPGAPARGDRARRARGRRRSRWCCSTSRTSRR